MADPPVERLGDREGSGRAGDFGRAVGWRKSSLSNANGNCVEVLIAGETVGVRDSKNRHCALVIRRAAWQAFVVGLRSATVCAGPLGSPRPGSTVAPDAAG